jgi:copper(I)-binding protein
LAHLKKHAGRKQIVKRIFILVILAGLLLSACGSEKGIEVHEVWMRPVSKGENGAVYFVIHNHAREADELTGASSANAVAAEIHESKMNGDVMEMRPVDSLPLEAYAEVKFEPGGYHLMLVDLKKDLNVGDEIEVTLHFKNFEDINLKVPVRDTPAPEEDHSSANH